MQRLWLTTGVAVCLAGCSVRNVEGRWQGPMPFENADVCQVLLKKGGAFEFGCTPEDTGWFGTGTWTQSDTGVEMHFDRVQRGETVLERPPLKLTVRFGEHGNELRPTYLDDAVWLREL